jgi:hypothetical protein
MYVQKCIYLFMYGGSIMDGLQIASDESQVCTANLGLLALKEARTEIM